MWLKITGNLDVPSFKHALDALIQRHEILRTHIYMEDETPYQTFEIRIKIDFNYTKIDNEDHEKNISIVDSTIEFESMKVFDLDHSPLHFCHLFELPGNEFYFAWVFDHIISDGISISILRKDLIEAYRQQVDFHTIEFKHQANGYGEYIEWENQFSPEQYDTDKEYWIHKLENLPNQFDFPTLKRPSVRTFHGEKTQAILPYPMHQSMINFCKENNITSFIFFVSVFALLVYRYSEQNDFVVGIPHANRNQINTLDTVGCFINTLLLRCQCDMHLKFSDLLAQLRTNAIEAYDHNSYPFEKIVELMQPNRDTIRNPLFQFFLNTRAKKQVYSLPELRIEVLSPPLHGSNFDLTVYFQDIGESTQIEFIYNPDILSGSLMQVFSHQFLYLCQQCLEKPDENIMKYSLIPNIIKNQLPDPREQQKKEIFPSVVDLFKEAGEKYPDHPAVIWRSKAYKYNRLQKDAQQIACFLTNQEFGKNDVVALSGSSSYGLISTMLGILMAGCTLLLLDPTLPEQRKRIMLDQGKTKLLFYADDEPDTAVNYASIQKEPYHSENGQLVNPDEQYLKTCHLSIIDGNSPAYITFTSGTSGVPKGIIGIHNSLSHFLIWQKEEFRINQRDQFVQLTNIGFDVIFRDILLPLISGATIHCPPDRALIASKDLFQWFSAENITILHTVPSLAKYWLSENALIKKIPSLRYTFFAGEKLSLALCDAWHTRFDGEIINLYGPSETTLAASFYREDHIHEVQPIGKSIPGGQLLVINHAGELAGVGEPGEIVIRTPYRSRGYLPDIQKETFRENPFNHDPQDLVYFSGDMGRYLADGSVAFIGRMDSQIKILGNRIEPQEVQAVLLRHPHIKNVYVHTQIPSTEHTPVLIAYVVVVDNVELSEAQVKDYLQQYVTRVSMPQKIIFLKQIPITRNGKIDPTGLPVFSSESGTSLQRTIKQPTNSIETQLLTIWQKFFIDQVISIEDNFFQLGGHSLMALNVCAEIENKLNKKISIADFFHFPTIYQLSQYFQNPSSDKDNPILPLQTFGEKPPLFGTNMRNGSASIYRLLVPFLAIDQPVYGLSISAKEILNAKSIQDIASHHIEVILSFDPVGPYYLCGYSFAGLIAFEMANQLEQSGKKVAFLGIIDTWLEKYDDFSQSLNHFQQMGYHLNKAVRNVKFHIRKINTLSLRGKIDYVISRSKQKARIHHVHPENILEPLPEISSENIEVVNHLKKLSNKYIPKKIDSRIWLFRAETPSSEFISYPNTFGWHFFSKNKLEIIVITGTHYSIMQGNDVKILGKIMQTIINNSRHL
jgi:amino acid adenylation domain-containing protein